MKGTKRLVAACATLMAAAALSACGSDTTAPVQTAVNASLRQFSITLDRSSAPQGRITFHVTNNGTVPHEFEVIRTNLPAASLPTHADGSYRENGPETILLGEVEDLMPGETTSLTLDLLAGRYVIICNMVGPLGSHYQLGMRTVFTVTA